MKQKIEAILRLLRICSLCAAIGLLAGPLVGGGELISPHYTLSVPFWANGGANTASPNYKIQAGTLGRGVSNRAQSANYQDLGGFLSPTPEIIVPLAANLNDAYVYPNPFKPNSPGSFQSAGITFKYLPAEATIRIFAITGKQVAELHKTDRAVDYYEWNVTNGDGQKLASGVYLYFITAPAGGKAKGKFAVIR